MEVPNTPPVAPTWPDRLRQGAPSLILLFILAVGAYLRYRGIDWDEGTHLHPDERFLTLVESAIQPVDSLAEYFNTESSTLNPNNVGHTFFVYGTLPIFIIRLLAEWLGRADYGQIYLIGRAASATFDLVSILLVYWIGRRLYDRRVGLLAAALSAVSVLLIQHAHFFVVDPFANTFILAGFFFAVRVLDTGRRQDYLLFGFLFGLAMASKISALPLAAMAGLAAGIRWYQAEPEARDRHLQEGLVGLGLAALVSLVTFRLFQPYAFSGPGLLGIAPNPRWLATMAEIRLQTSGQVDFPPALQWADRLPVWFSWKNMVLWGMGPALGIAAWVSWAWAAWQIGHGRRWQRHLLPVVWTAGYFLWQSSAFTQAMRYQLPVYPILAILAAWGLWTAWDRARQGLGRWRRVPSWLPAALGVSVLAVTTAYAFAFLKVYTEPMTRVEASRWIYRNVPAAVSLVVETDQGDLLDPLAVPEDLVLRAGQPLVVGFNAQFNGAAQAVLTPFVESLIGQAEAEQLIFELFEGAAEGQPLASAHYTGGIASNNETRVEVGLEPVIELRAGANYNLRMTVLGAEAIGMDGGPALVVETENGQELQRVELPQEQLLLRAGGPELLTFDARLAGTAIGVRLARIESLGRLPAELRVELRSALDGSVLAVGARSIDTTDDLAAPVTIDFSGPIAIESGLPYQLVMTVSDGTAVALRGSVIIHETGWDDPLPTRVDGYDPGGRYPSRNLEAYWPDNEDKDGDGQPDQFERILDSFSQGDFFFISSNRQYGTIARVPSRYPLTTAFYRALLDCPAPQTVATCADRAQPGSTGSRLGYELIRVFETNPGLFGIEISDQSAEESFTVYDHPQVLVFAKAPNFDPDLIRQELGGIDVSRAINAGPAELTTDAQSQSLMLPLERWRQVTALGTWNELFPQNSLLNNSQPLAVVAWWLTLAALGWLSWPLVRRLFPGLDDGGYAVARVFGLLLFAWLAWLLGSQGVLMTRASLWLILLGMALVGAAAAWRDRIQIGQLLEAQRRQILMVELLALGFFMLDLLIRFGNPDLWHPSKGGEKPMDLSYLTAVLKSPTFPPYDPWFAGGYINYYYFGFVIIGLPMKLLGIEPGVAYNLAIPTLFALLAVAAYTTASHLFALGGGTDARLRRWAGVGAALALVVFGNLGTVRLLFEGLQQIAGGASNLFTGLIAAVRGVIEVVVGGRPLPIALDSWYWNPSRAIPPGPGEPGPITEFPFFTFLYADLHAHMISLPLTVAALAWGVSWLRAAANQIPLRLWQTVAALAAGGLLIGALRPTNTWDFPVYLILAGLAALMAPVVRRGWSLRSIAVGLASAGLVAAFSYLLYLPFSQWYVQGYNQAQLWQGSKTTIDAYLTVYGLFLFVLVGWFLWETRQWMAATPLSALSPAKPRLGYILGAVAGFASLVLVLTGIGYRVMLPAIPLMVWAGLLLLRPALPLGKRVVLFLAGTALALTLVVEVVVLQGDIGRMNTVFKFYLQVWTLLSLASGAALGWILADQPRWSPGWRGLWQIGLALLVFGAALYPLTATPAKLRDRMSVASPATLDGLAFMKDATRGELAGSFALVEDYQAIQWLQHNVEGSPIIVEANIPEYRWGSRFTIYTGLPGVLGWNWHQRQQRVASPEDEVTERALDITDFYTTTSVERARAFLGEYDVRYVIAGHLEQIYYGSVEPCWPTGGVGQLVSCDLAGRPMGMTDPAVAPASCERLYPDGDDPALRCPTGGLAKFDEMVERGWLRVVFEVGSTRIYQVTE